ncbi:hypothetical protein P3S68_006632 [Capsicum galapagoense]
MSMVHGHFSCNNETEANPMDQRLPVDAITPEITDWTCKIQVVDKFWPRKSSDSSVHFQTILVQDECEQQVSIILYGNDIPKYENLFGLLRHIWCHVRKLESPAITQYARLCMNGWRTDTQSSKQLPTTMDLRHPFLLQQNWIRSLSQLLKSNVQVSNSQALWEAIVIDQSKKPFLFTIWGDLDDNEGATLLHHLHEYPVILARRIGVTEFRSALRLATRYQSTILTNPQMKYNERMLLSYTLRSSSTSSSSLNLAPIEDQVLAISTIPQVLSTVQSFTVKARLSLPDRPQSFYLLACSHCNQFVRPKTKKMVRCFNCKLERQLVPKCHFEVNIMDASDTIMVMISETLGERMLSLTSEQIYEQVAVQQQPLCIARINQLVAHKLFTLQLQKPLYRFPDQKAGMLAITSFTETPFSPEQTGKRQKIDSPTPAKTK